MMSWYGTGMGWGGWLVMGLFWLLLVAVVATLVVRSLPRTARHSAGADPRLETPEEILRRRLAEGTIDTETYQKQRAALMQGRRR